MTPGVPHIPYGQADFRRIRLNRWLYVDKTRFVRQLEGVHHAVFIRPRRFGKTCWLSLLESYYSRVWAGDFDAVFGGTDLGREPTPERGRYLVLRFNFSAFNDALPSLERNFEEYCGDRIAHALNRNRDWFPERVAGHILTPPSASGKLGRLFIHAGDEGIPVYVLVDEYDNFANTILAHHGEEAYRSVTHGGGFYRNFFAALKAGTETSGGGLERLFLTGVSPITLDDVTSGFNIGRNLSLDPRFNEMLGFTEAEVRGLLERYRDGGAFVQDVEEALALMRAWYDGYRFAEEAEASVYNTDMVLYFLEESISNRAVPRYLIDQNVRIDYGKLRHLLVVGRKLNGNFDLLRELVGEERVECDLQPGFPLERLAERENFLSLLHYFGLASIRGVGRGRPVLGIPNQTVRRLLYGFLRDGFEDVRTFSVDGYRFGQLMSAMANEGEWRAVFAHLGEAIAAQTGIRDYLGGEKVVQGFLAAYLGLGSHFVLRSEAELGKGYADLMLEPLLARYPQLRYGYLIELKYLRRGDRADEEAVSSLVGEASAQLRGYLADPRLARQYPGVRFIGLALVFHGWEQVYCEEVVSVAA